LERFDRISVSVTYRPLFLSIVVHLVSLPSEIERLGVLIERPSAIKSMQDRRLFYLLGWWIGSAILQIGY
jgi:hypothetical protein